MADTRKPLTPAEILALPDGTRVITKMGKRRRKREKIEYGINRLMAIMVQHGEGTVWLVEDSDG